MDSSKSVNLATVTFILATLYFCRTGTTNVSTTATTKQPIEPKAQINCRKKKYPIVGLDFTLPDEWNAYYKNVSFQEWAKGNMFKIFYQRISITRPDGDGKWVEIKECTTLQVVTYNQISCLYNYINVYKDEIAFANVWNIFKIEFDTSHLNKTLRHFVFKTSQNYGRKFAFANNNTFHYDFSHWDVFNCLRSYKPVFMSSGYCNHIVVKWYWPMELFAFHKVWKVRLLIHDGHSHKVIQPFHPGLNKQLYETNITNLISDTTYNVCISLNYFPPYLELGTNIADRKLCQRVHLYCKQQHVEKENKTILSIEWTMTIVILLTLTIIIMIIIIVYLQKRIVRNAVTDDTAGLITSREVDESEFELGEQEVIPPHSYAYVEA